ncbi:MAG: class F sortase [Dermatophilaceae bacterium]
MRRRPLVVGAIVAVIGVALVLLGLQRGADGASAVGSDPSPTTSPSGATREPGTTTSEAPGSSMTAVPPGTTTGPATGPAATAEPPAPPATALETGPTLRIPGIGLDADLHAEGLRGGKINPPARTVMWFTGYDRVAPGEVGTSVIAGHVVANGRADVFNRLSRVAVGDKVQIVGDDGVETFRVVRAGVVDKDELTVDQAVWGANSSVRRLAIITCDDAFGFRSDGHRVANYVVIAEPA